LEKNLTFDVFRITTLPR